MDPQIYTNYYDIEFPVGRAAYSPAEGVLKFPYTVTLTAKALPDYERAQVMERFQKRLSKLEREIGDIQQTAITNRLLWRCAALACLQVQDELFALQSMALMLMANGAPLGQAYALLHQLQQRFMAHITQFPGLEIYYRLPDQDQPGNETSTPMGEALASPCQVSILHRTDFEWDGISCELHEVVLQGGSPYGYAILYVREGARQPTGWYALRGESIRRAERDGLVVTREDNWCRGFAFLIEPSEGCCPDRDTAFVHIHEDVQRLQQAGNTDGNTSG